MLQEPGAPREYIGDPVATRAFFRDGWFYPGDLGVLDGKGRLMLSGRVTDILVVKGDKIPSARSRRSCKPRSTCTASASSPSRGRRRRRDAYRAGARGPDDKARLEALAKPYLTYFPTVSFHQLAAFPRNANGKVDRLKLRLMLVELGRARAAE